MALTTLASTALFLLLINIVFSPVSSHYVPKCPPTPSQPSQPPPTPSSPPPTPSNPPPTPSNPPPTPTPSNPPPETPYYPSPPKQPPPTPTPETPSYPPPAYKPKCPRDTLKLGVCANVLNDLVHLVVGTPPKTPCCNLIKGLADLEAAVCLCTAIKGNILGINLDVPITLTLLLNYCGKGVPSGFQCP